MKKPLAVIFLVLFVDMVAFSMLLPLVGLYGRHYSATGFRLALLGGAFSIMQFLFAPFWGALSDRRGRRSVLLVTISGGTAALFAFGFARSYAVLLAARALSGVFAANISVAQAYVADISTPENRAKGMGMVGAAIGLGFVFGPPIGGISALKLGLEAPGYLAGALSLINLALAYRYVPEPERPVPAPSRQRFSREARQLLSDSPALRLYAIVGFLATFGFCQMEQAFALFLQSTFTLETAEAGYTAGLVMMWIGICGAIVQGGLIRRIVPRFGEHRLLVAGAVILAAGMALFPAGQSMWWFYMVGTLFAIGAGISNPSLFSLISRSVPEDQQGMAMGLTQGFSSLARAIAPLLALSSFGWWHPLPFFIACGSYVAVVLVCIRNQGGTVPVWKQHEVHAAH